MKKGIWNIILYKEDNDKLVRLDNNNPKNSGVYLCTCVNFWKGKEAARYLQMMYYDVEKNHWHDCGNASGISHNILAWTDEIKPCDFTDFDYVIGGYFVEKNV